MNQTRGEPTFDELITEPKLREQLVERTNDLVAKVDVMEKDGRTPRIVFLADGATPLKEAFLSALNGKNLDTRDANIGSEKVNAIYKSISLPAKLNELWQTDQIYRLPGSKADFSTYLESVSTQEDIARIFGQEALTFLQNLFNCNDLLIVDDVLSSGATTVLITHLARIINPNIHLDFFYYFFDSSLSSFYTAIETYFDVRIPNVKLEVSNELVKKYSRGWLPWSKTRKAGVSLTDSSFATSNSDSEKSALLAQAANELKTLY